MARHKRLVLPGQPQHVIQRGINRDVVFVDEEDYRFYLDSLKQVCQKYRCRLHAYVLMTNHAHLLITPATDDGLGKTLQSLGRRYVQNFNDKYQRTGTLWEGRYKSALIDTERYLLTCYRYIEMNPVRAGMVSTPGEYPWTSYHFNALGTSDSLVSPHPLYLRLGGAADERYSAYRALFHHHVGTDVLDKIRNMTNTEWIIGNDRFAGRVAQLLGRQTRPRARGGDRKSEKFRGKV
ncbi:MAG TPA: transposase [Gammaproteobacteria bacterium]|nr:transposase [Gammaproteobacteria bacterium]